jgi:hypothetical protein
MTSDPDRPQSSEPLFEQAPERLSGAPSAAESLKAMWLYSLLRFGLFFLLWALLFLCTVPGLLAALLAVVLSLPLSFVLLRRQRARLASNLERRVEARRGRRDNLDDRLSGDR